MGEVSLKFNHLLKQTQNVQITSPVKNNIYYADFINIKNRICYNGYSELCIFVQSNIKTLLSSGIEKKPKILQIITDKDFLIGMQLAEIELSSEYVTNFNRIYRAYMINPSNNVLFNEDSARELYRLAYKYNKEWIEKLINISLKETEALWLVVNRFSSTDERRNIRRMVRAIQHLSQDYMTEEVIMKIFEIFFNDQVSSLFCAVMTDKLEVFDNSNEEYVYSTVSNALLNVLTTMNTDDIRDILKTYLDELQKSGARGRFSLNSINPTDYKNIVEATKELESMGVKIY
jgi:hypothetical protein